MLFVSTIWLILHIEGKIRYLTLLITALFQMIFTLYCVPIYEDVVYRLIGFLDERLFDVFIMFLILTERILLIITTYPRLVIQ